MCKGLQATIFDWPVLRERCTVQFLGEKPIGSITRRDLHPGYNCIPLLDLESTATRALSTEITRRFMMADFRVFVTAPSADYKAINEMLLYLRDWEDGSGDCFHLQTADTIEESEKTSDTPVPVPVAIPGTFTAVNFQKAWAGVSIKEVEAFATQELDSIASPQAHVGFFLVLDEQGVEDHTVLCVAKDEPEESDNKGDEDGEIDEPEHSQPASRDSRPIGDAVTQYNKVRMPWHVAYSFCANLGESNMGFEEFCDQDIGPDERLYWKVNEDLTEDDVNGEDAMRRRTKFLEKLRREDLV
jgi:hypothetical protein